VPYQIDLHDVGPLSRHSFCLGILPNDRNGSFAIIRVALSFAGLH